MASVMAEVDSSTNNKKTLQRHWAAGIVRFWTFAKLNQKFHNW